MTEEPVKEVMLTDSQVRGIVEAILSNGLDLNSIDKLGMAINELLNIHLLIKRLAEGVSGSETEEDKEFYRIISNFDKNISVCFPTLTASPS
jgi:hypothetical protein